MSWFGGVCITLGICSSLFLTGCGGGAAANSGTSTTSTPPPPPPPATGSFQVSVQMTGNGSGNITSTPTGINCGSACSAAYQGGSSVALTATANTGSIFLGWSGNCTGAGTCNLVVNGNKSVTGAFATKPGPGSSELSVSVSGSGTVTSSPAGINCGNTCNAQFTTGTEIVLTATAAGGSSFAGWGGACSGSNNTCQVDLTSSTLVSASFTTNPTLSVNESGSGQGTVTSTPAGINCPPTCQAVFTNGTQVTLNEDPATGSAFAGWNGGCTSYYNACTVTAGPGVQVGIAFNIVQGLNGINHIIFLAQENHSFDDYFGELRQYWADNGYPDQPFNGLPQFNPPPNNGPPPTNPGCDPNSPPPKPCVFDPNALLTSFHFITQCVEDPSNDWGPSHDDWDYYDPTGLKPAQLNSFVWTGASFARLKSLYDTAGLRAMGYYDGGNPNNGNDPGDLNYYYYMASNFATSDSWFSPVLSRTEPNRQYLIAATSQGHARELTPKENLLTSTTIFQALQSAGITWKIYINPTGSSCNPPYDPNCLVGLSYVHDFQWGYTIPKDYPQDLGTIGISGGDFENDLQNGTLPQVVQIEPASPAGLDEHPSSDLYLINIQSGAQYVASLISELMQSQYWKDSVFILTYDEFGGFYDHVAPQQTVNPDGINPIDLQPKSVCYQINTQLCDFEYTGYRVPLLVISPYTRKNYVSHTVADFTAILKLIETRFGLSSLTLRDAAQMDMTEFFDFTNPPWTTPPTPPPQNKSPYCYVNKLP